LPLSHAVVHGYLAPMLAVVLARFILGEQVSTTRWFAVGGIAHIMMTLSLQKAEVSKLAPFEYLSLIFAVIADFMLFNNLPGIAFAVSATLILGAMWLVTFKDRSPKKSVAH